MSGPAMVLLFGLSCPDPCALEPAERAAIERQVTQLLGDRGMSVKPAPDDARRPTGATASTEPVDEAAALEVDRVVVLNLEAGGKLLWVSHFVRGTVGTWTVAKTPCGPGEGGAFDCPSLSVAVQQGMRPRRADEVDFTSALRAHSKIVGRCVVEEDDVHPAERIYGRIEVEIEARPTGDVKVKSIAPALASRSRLGACLRRAFERMYVGRFEGDAVKMRVPIDL